MKGVEEELGYHKEDGCLMVDGKSSLNSEGVP
jgi:hypothetical protein